MMILLDGESDGEKRMAILWCWESDREIQKVNKLEYLDGT